MSGGSRCVTGLLQGTGASMAVTKVGFKPRYIRVVNLDDPSALEFMEGMTDAHGFKHIDGTQSHITSLGITPTNTGFTLGADTDINVDGEQLAYVCWD
jgi:hypothetical protein